MRRSSVSSGGLIAQLQQDFPELWASCTGLKTAAERAAAEAGRTTGAAVHGLVPRVDALIAEVAATVDEIYIQVDEERTESNTLQAEMETELEEARDEWERRERSYRSSMREADEEISHLKVGWGHLEDQYRAARDRSALVRRTSALRTCLVSLWSRAATAAQAQKRQAVRTMHLGCIRHQLRRANFQPSYCGMFPSSAHCFHPRTSCKLRVLLIGLIVMGLSCSCFAVRALQILHLPQMLVAPRGQHTSTLRHNGTAMSGVHVGLEKPYHQTVHILNR